MFKDSKVETNKARLRRIHRDIMTEKYKEVANPLEKQLQRYKKSMEANKNDKNTK